MKAVAWQGRTGTEVCTVLFRTAPRWHCSGTPPPPSAPQIDSFWGPWYMEQVSGAALGGSALHTATPSLSCPQSLCPACGGHGSTAIQWFWAVAFSCAKWTPGPYSDLPFHALTNMLVLQFLFYHDTRERQDAKTTCTLDHN